MDNICKKLLLDVKSKDEPFCYLLDDEYSTLCDFASRFPTFPVIIKSDMPNIKSQYISIARKIVSHCPNRNLLIPSLFAATRHIMQEYFKVDPSIPDYHAIWLDSIIKEVNTQLNITFFNFIVRTVIIMFICLMRYSAPDAI